MTQLVEDALPAQDRVIALDRVLENLDKSQVTARGVEGVKADPPRIFWSAPRRAPSAPSIRRCVKKRLGSRCSPAPTTR